MKRTCICTEQKPRDF